MFLKIGWNQYSDARIVLKAEKFILNHQFEFVCEYRASKRTASRFSTQNFECPGAQRLPDEGEVRFFSLCLYKVGGFKNTTESTGTGFQVPAGTCVGFGLRTR
jgi:hypothetical protein